MIRIFFFLPVLLMALSTSATVYDIDLHADVAVSAKYYRLQDIATVSGPEAGALKRLPIGISPRPGKAFAVTTAQVKAAIARKKPELTADIQWGGSQVTKIRSVGREIVLQPIYRLAEKTLDQWLTAKPYTDFKWKLARSLDTIEVPVNGDISYSAIVANNPSKAARRMAIWVDVFVDGVDYHTYQVWFEVSAFQSVLTAAVDLAQGIRLQSAMLQTAIVDIADVHSEPITHSRQLLHKQLLQPLAAGEILVERTLSTIPMVTKGNPVEVDVNVGNIAIKTTAIAMQSGKLYEKINVLNPSTDARYATVVVDWDRVRVK